MKIENTEIRLAMLGMIEGNGHPYSWSAIVNGYNPKEMAQCPFPVIPQYLADLNQFILWHQAGKVFLSSSNMRYAPEIKQVMRQKAQLGELRWIATCTSKTWERYAIHALEGIWPVLGPGFLTVRTESRSGSDIAYITHQSGVQVNLAVIYDAVGSYGALHVFGTKGNLAVSCWDTYTAFRNQLCAFVEMLRTGERPYPLSETIELMAVIIAGLRSREREGQVVKVDEVLAELEPPLRR